ncbi:hypothetical protein FOMPIDRAFT_91890 [Fomitopsis schrenkii]|uniref:Uncharacterized protein n=1 Tax=Fomitopsis schrenkii TaxID=2126942 RepID=S8FGS6_FOMSC|nr:hypothetical protein FOMPIDRAFT_91890 [Fomitopsis schrenkii]
MLSADHKRLRHRCGTIAQSAGVVLHLRTRRARIPQTTCHNEGTGYMTTANTEKSVASPQRDQSEVAVSDNPAQTVVAPTPSPELELPSDVPDTPDDDADEWLPRGPIKQNTSSGTKNTNVRR